MEAVARRLLGPPNPTLSSAKQWRYGTHGSLAVEIDGEKAGTWYDFEAGEGGGVLDLIARQTGHANGAAIDWIASELGIRLDGEPQRVAGRGRIVATYDYQGETGELLFQVVRLDPKDFRQRRPDGSGGWEWSVRGVRQVPYRLPELLKRPEGAPVFVVEGEKDADRLAALGLAATTNAGGAGKWRDELSEHLRGATVYVLPDADDTGREHARQVATSLRGIAASVRVVELPGLGDKEDVSDWLDAGGTVDQLLALCAGPAAAGEEDDHAPPDPWIAHDAVDLIRGHIPPRQWLLGTILCRKFVAVLAAKGGSGKTALILAWAISLAIGRAVIGDHVHKKSRTVVFTFEDDIEEYSRRLRAACMHHGVVDKLERGQIEIIALAGLGITLATVGKDGTLSRTEAADRVKTTIRERGSDVAIFDPFVKLSDGDENDNRAADFLAQILVGVAIETNTAVLTAHHNRKGLAEPGNIDTARGAGAIIDAARAALTLVPMSEKEAKLFGVGEEERRRLIRLDNGKANLTPSAAKAIWYRLASVAIGNGTADYPDGDNVQAVEHWQPPDFWAGLPLIVVNAILDAIAAGLPSGERFSGAPAAGRRAAWPVVVKHAPGLNETQARAAVATWLKNGLLKEEDCEGADRKPAKGLAVNPGLRPGACGNG